MGVPCKVKIIGLNLYCVSLERPLKKFWSSFQGDLSLHCWSFWCIVGGWRQINIGDAPALKRNNAGKILNLNFKLNILHVWSPCEYPRVDCSL